MEAGQTSGGESPAYGFERGRCLPNFEFVTVEGARKDLSDFKGRKNLVLIFAGEKDEALLNAVAGAFPAFEDLEAHVIAVMKMSARRALRVHHAQRWPFDLVLDAGGALQRTSGAENGQGSSGLAVYVTDRWAEVVFACRTLHGDPVPGIADLLGWLAFVDHQCPECFPSEWPA